MPLGAEVGLGSGHILLDGGPAPPPQKGTQQPLPTFRRMSVAAKRLDESGCHAVGTEVGLGLGYIVLDGGQAPPHGKEHSSLLPTCRPMPIVAKRSPISATAALFVFV